MTVSGSNPCYGHGLEISPFSSLFSILLSLLLTSLLSSPSSLFLISLFPPFPQNSWSGLKKLGGITFQHTLVRIRILRNSKVPQYVLMRQLIEYSFLSHAWPQDIR